MSAVPASYFNLKLNCIRKFPALHPKFIQISQAKICCQVFLYFFAVPKHGNWPRITRITRKNYGCVPPFT